jgi:hypothetical protein
VSYTLPTNSIEQLLENVLAADEALNQCTVEDKAALKQRADDALSKLSEACDLTDGAR